MLRLVDERNEVVEWLDYHRQLEKEEELQVAKSITEFSVVRNTPSPVLNAIEPISTGQGKKTKTKSKEDKASKKAEKGKKSKGDDGLKKKDSKSKLGLFTKKFTKSPKSCDDVKESKPH